MKKKSRGKRKLFDWRYVGQERRRSYNWALILFGSVAMFFFVQRFVIHTSIITDRSMLPTLHEGEYVLVNKYLYHLRPPRRGEIIMVRETEMAEDRYVKRVIGLPGDTLLIEGGFVYVNGEKLEEPYTAGKTYPPQDPILLDQNHYFVLGDNRLDSRDSRVFGAIPLEFIEGKLDPTRWFPFD